MVTFYKSLISVSIILSISIFTILSCASSFPDNFEYEKNKFIDLKNFVSQSNSGDSLDTFLLNQLDPKKQYFSKESYIQFSDTSIWPGIREPWKSSTIELFDLYIDYRLLNNFILVFTNQHSDEIMYCITQDSFISNFKYRYYFLDQRDFEYPLGFGMYDVYGFHNNQLVFKSTYSPDNMDYMRVREFDNRFKLDSLKIKKE